MKYLALLLATLLLLAACTLPIQDTPQLRDAIETRYALTVLPPPQLPRTIRFTLHITPTPLPDWTYTVTPTPEPNQ